MVAEQVTREPDFTGTKKIQDDWRPGVRSASGPRNVHVRERADSYPT